MHYLAEYNCVQLGHRAKQASIDLWENKLMEQRATMRMRRLLTLQPDAV
jgi:hypothetical protein